MDALIVSSRKAYHQRLLSSILTVNEYGIPSNADKDNVLSVRIAKGITDRLIAETGVRVQAQSSGNKFEECNMSFLTETFTHLQNLRPGTWNIMKLGNRSPIKTSDFAQYEHLAYLAELTKTNNQLAAALGNDYMVAPDVIIYRNLYEDNEINADEMLIDENVCKAADLRKSNGGKPILHASISSKWTIRSDRAQNSRTEALNLIRNRKGHLPHIVVVTGEPLPSRLASIALGTGDIDCVYHFALYELLDAVKDAKADDAIDMLHVLIDGKRLKDVSDLPLDLSI